MDFDAGLLLDGADVEEQTEALFWLCLAVAEGEKTVGERAGACDIAIFKDGVTL